MSRNYAERLIHYLETSDIEAALLRAHLAVEAMLEHAVELCFDRPEYFRRLGLTAHRKITLAAGLGVITPESAKALARLNELRNRVAHRWSYELTKRPRRLYQDASG